MADLSFGADPLANLKAMQERTRAAVADNPVAQALAQQAQEADAARAQAESVRAMLELEERRQAAVEEAQRKARGAIEVSRAQLDLTNALDERRARREAEKKSAADTALLARVEATEAVVAERRRRRWLTVAMYGAGALTVGAILGVILGSALEKRGEG